MGRLSLSCYSYVQFLDSSEKISIILSTGKYIYTKTLTVKLILFRWIRNLHQNQTQICQVKSIYKSLHATTIFMDIRVRQNANRNNIQIFIWSIIRYDALTKWMEQIFENLRDQFCTNMFRFGTKELQSKLSRNIPAKSLNSAHCNVFPLFFLL